MGFLLLNDGDPTVRGPRHTASAHSGDVEHDKSADRSSRLLDAMAVGSAEVSADGRVLRPNARLCAMLKYPSAALQRLTLQALLPGEDPPLRLADLAPGRHNDHSSATLRPVRRSDGSEIWVELSAIPVDGSYMVTFVDMSAFKAMEMQLAEAELRAAELELGRQELPLAQELNHRLRNVFPIILLLVKMTAERHPAAVEYCHALERRLRALAAAEDLMRRAENNAVSLEALLRTELQPFRGNARITIDGPLVILRGAAAQCFVIILHELTTNAAKHGSLGLRGGRLAVRWQLFDREGGGRLLRFEWLERGGPSVSPSGHHGFGTFVIGQSGELLGGTSSAEYAPEGLTYHLELPIDRGEAAEDA